MGERKVFLDDLKEDKGFAKKLCSLTPVWPETEKTGLMRVVCRIYKQQWNRTHSHFFQTLIQEEIKTLGMSMNTAQWIQESCRSFVLIHPDITILSIPFENGKSGILWNHRRSQDTLYHMSLKFYCFTHLLVDFFLSACSSCSLLCCYSYRTVTWNLKSKEILGKVIQIIYNSSYFLKSWEFFFFLYSCCYEKFNQCKVVFLKHVNKIRGN